MSSEPDLSAVIAPLLEDPARTGVFTDFDGTLAPIVDDPESARPLEEAIEALGAVARKVGGVGVISGRPASFLLRFLGDVDVSVWGLYGLERVDRASGEPEVVASPEAEDWRPAVDEAAERAEQDFGERVGVERKGLTLTLHFRRATHLEDEVRQWAEAAAESSGLALHGGKMSFELRPPVTGDKGTVLEEAASGFSAACFFGDDRGDLEAFDALDRLAERGTATVRIGVRSEEAPAELLDRADLVVDGPPGVVEVLRVIAGG